MIGKNLKNITILSLGILLVVTIFFAIKSSSQGNKLASLEEKAREISEQNHELSDKIVQETSLTKVNTEAVKMGMTKPESFVYMSSSGIALR